ncbi:MAG: hypothetical protein IJ237_10165 [Oscillospiraceae bacterium]|nr:hypothetical protein [Oscillospiraceae bacterium]
MKTKLDDELLENVVGGRILPKGNVLVPKDKEPSDPALKGTAVCPVCGKRYDPAAPHFCKPD